MPRVYWDPSFDYEYESGELYPNEDDGNAELVVYLSHPVGYNVDVRYELMGPASGEAATRGTDFNLTVDGGNQGVVHIPAGQSSGKIALGLMSDALVENPESFQIKLLEDNPAAGPARYLLDDGYYESTVGDTVSVTLIDGEPFVYMEEYYEEELYEGDSRTVYVYLSRAADVSVTLPIVVDPTSTATVGSDFTVPANVTIPAGQTSGSFTVTTLSDAVVEEPSESIKLNLGDFSSYPIWDVNAWYNAYSAYPMADIPAYTSTSMELTIQDYSIEEPSPAP